MIEGIYGFHGENNFLSNFYESCSFYYRGMISKSVEHAYQAEKAVSLENFEEIMNSHTPGRAKRLGREIKCRDNWDSIKVQVMYSLLILKFHDFELRNKLLGTGDLYLEETNTWNDTFWGVCKGKGRNVLGNLLMKVRKDLNNVATLG